MINHRNHVLLIEDNPGDADLVRLRLVEGMSNVDVRCVDRLSTGLASLTEGLPSLVLLDLNLPDSRGAETFRSVLKNAPGVPVVVLSGQSDEELAAKALHQGVQDYLVKGDFNSKQLARAMRYAIERQALLRSLEMSRQQQLEFKNQFLSHVSHELRTPLTCIHQFVTILMDGLAGPILPEQRDHLGTILKSVNQLRAMIRDLVEATRAESGKIRIEPRCISIGVVMQQAVAMMQVTAEEKQIRLEVGLDTKIPLVYADPNRVLEILINLIDNGIKFTPAGGSVMVKVCLVDADADFVYVSVADSGCGISPEVKPLIFERLYQDPNAVDNNRKGLGLGLYIAKELVGLHGGRIWVTSEPRHGSTVSFTLPLYSLAKLLTPVIISQGRLRDSIVLVGLKLTPLATFPVGQWEDRLQRCREILRCCILPDKDLLLPFAGVDGKDETFFVVASADLDGANILLNRIQEQLEGCSELKASAVFKTSTAPVQLPSRESVEPVEKLVHEVADRINEMLMLNLSRRQSSEDQPHQPTTTTQRRSLSGKRRRFK